MIKVAITMRASVDPKHGERRDALSRDWIDYLGKLDSSILLFPIVSDPRQVEQVFNEINPDRIILTNGEDIGVNTERDEAERKLLKEAVNRDTAVLGVCRGMQVINNYFGGAKMIQTEDHVTANHSIKFIEQLNYLNSQKSIWNVNSYHKNAIQKQKLSSEFDGLAVHGAVVEFIRHKYKKIFGIQWHPERPNQDQNETDELIKSFLKNGVM